MNIFNFLFSSLSFVLCKCSKFYEVRTEGMFSEL